MESFELWTDGACSGAPGPGGWAAILLHEGGQTLGISGFEGQTTSNRMELTAVVQGLQALGTVRARVLICTDSAYVKNAFTSGWVKNWQRNGWKSYRGDSVANRDLWEQLIDAVAGHIVSWKKVKGHALAQTLNHEVDAMAVQAKQQQRAETKLLS